MAEPLDIDPLLREFLELRRGLSSNEIAQLIQEWNGQGAITDFLTGKALLDRTTAKMLITAQKGYMGSSEEEVRTVLGIKLRTQPKKKPSEDTNADSPQKQESATSSDARRVDNRVPEPEPFRTPPTQPPLTANGQQPPAMPPAIATAATATEDNRDATPTPTPTPNPALLASKPRKSATGRRGFLGATDEEVRHLLGRKPPEPAAAAASKTTSESAARSGPAPAVPIRAADSATDRVAVSPNDSASQSGNARAVPPDSVAQQGAAHPHSRSLTNMLSLKPDISKPEPKVGEYVDRYYLEEAIGEGATATIFRSFHKLLRIPVAIKVYKREAMASDPIGAQRFLTEAQVLIRMEHPNIVRVLDIAVHDGAPYIVFEYVGELSLQGMIGNIGHLPPQRVAQIGAQVSAALEIANSHGLLHRDVKPDNILIRKDGLAKLADFGIATKRASDGRTADELARAGLISGTPQYISPEQITTPDQIDFRADMYSLGATLYHAACGHPPFERDSIDELLHAQLEDSPIPLTRIDPNIDPELSSIIERMLSKDPNERFRNLSEVRQKLDVVANRIQNEAMQRRRKSLSSSAISPVPTAIGHESSTNSPDRSPVVTISDDSESRQSASARRSSGNQLPVAVSGSLELRTASRTTTLLMLTIAFLVIGTVVFVLSRFAR